MEDKSEQTAEFTNFLTHYWSILQGRTNAHCGDEWKNDLESLSHAYLFMFGAINWYGRKNGLPIDQILSIFAMFSIQHLDVSTQDTQKMLDELIEHIEKSDAAVDIIIEGQEAVIAFLNDNLEALDRLSAILKQKLKETDLKRQQNASKISVDLLPNQSNSLFANNHLRTLH